MQAAQLFCDGMILAILLLRQPFDPPDLGKELANLFPYVIAILLGHACSSNGSSDNLPKTALAFLPFPFHPLLPCPKLLIYQ
jgi:hypothetical protein